MSITPARIPDFLKAINAIVQEHEEEITALDQALGDGDHVTNLQRGLHVLIEQEAALAAMADWSVAFNKIGMSLMNTVGGASGALLGMFFVTLGKHLRGKDMNAVHFAEALSQGVEAIKQRGKADRGDKTMLDTLIPAVEALKQASEEGQPLETILARLNQAAEEGAQSTRDMVATKGRASYLGERSRGLMDAGAKTSQLMILAASGIIGGLVVLHDER
jgi:dihydroxyacetone kinase-like protein